MPMAQDYYNYVHGKAAPTTGVDIVHAASEYSEDELDTELTSPGFLKDGKSGLHILVNEAFDTLTSITFHIVHGAATAPTTSVISRLILLASLVAGAHIYVPFPAGVQLLRYVRGYAELGGSAASAGQVCMWFGPPDGSENT